MPKNLSEDLCWRIVYLHHDGYSNKKIRELLKVSRSSVGRVLRLYKVWGCVSNPFAGTRGRRKVFDVDDMEVIQYIAFNWLLLYGRECGKEYENDNDCLLKILKAFINQKSDWYLDELVAEMEQHTGKVVSIPTLWRSLKHCGITRKKVDYSAYVFIIMLIDNCWWHRTLAVQSCCGTKWTCT
jgi:transposase